MSKSVKSRYKIVAEIIAAVVIALLLGTSSSILKSGNYLLFLPHIVLLFIAAGFYYIGEREGG